MEKEREDLKSIEPNINRTLENNDKISDSFKDMTKACFARIFYMLGEKNFKRWIDRKQLNSQIKELIIESMPKEEMEKHPSWLGYYTCGTNKIKLSTILDADSIKDTNVHETFHLITDIGKYFATFLNEGLTEYMKGMAINKATSYSENVEFIQFLHENLGDLIIKAYLTGKPDIFNEQLLNLVNYDGKSTISDIKQFYKNLNIFHDYTSNKLEKELLERNGETPEIAEKADKRYKTSKQNYENVESQVLDMCQKIIAGKISEMTANMEFYEAGENKLNLNLENASKTINQLIKSFNIRKFLANFNYEKIAEWEKQTGIMAAEQILEKSHILIGYSAEEKETRKQELIEKMLPKAEIIKTQGKRGVITQITTTHPKIKNSDITQQENSNVIGKLFDKYLKDDMNITQYIETIAKISQKAQLDNNELENYLNKYNIKFFGNVSNFRNINSSIISMLPKIQNLSEIEMERKKNTISSEYKSIGDNRYIEKRDNQVFLVELDENGEFLEQEVKYAKQTILLKGGTKLEVNYQKGLQNLSVKLNNKEVHLGKNLSLNDIKDIELTKVFSKDIRNNVKNGNYFTILDDAENPYKIKGVSYSADIDKRTRKINFDKYIADIKNILPLIPASQKENFILETTENLLDRTYKIDSKNISKIQEAYNAITGAISELVNETENAKYNQSILSANSEILSNARLDMVKNNEKKAAIFFENSTAKITYNIVQKQKREIENKKYVQEAKSKFEYGKFYHQEGEVPLDELPYHLAGVSVTQPIDSRSVVFLYKEFSEEIKKLISEYPQSSQDEIFNTIFNIQLQKTYLLDKNDLANQDLLKSVKNIRDSIKENIFSNTPIDEQKISDNLNVLNELKIQKSKEGQKTAGVIFNNKHTKDMFYTFSDIIELVKKSGVKNSELENEIKSIMDSQLQHDSEKENELPEN